jgi:ADP-heptose:LPS heptosyltransferase
LGIKNLFIHGASDINETAPYGTYSKVVRPHLSCSPCRGKCKFNTEKCLQQITPEAVFGNIKEWIK